MDVKELVRKEVEVGEPYNLDEAQHNEKVSLGNQAYHELGYYQLYKEMSGKEERVNGKYLNRKKAADAFAAVGIQPLDFDLVRRYKAEAVEKKTRRYAFVNFCNNEDTGDTLMVLAGIVGAISSIIFALVPGFIAPQGQMPHPILFAQRHPYWGMVSLSLLLTWWGIAAVRKISKNMKTTYHWEAIPLRIYEKPIPEFALAHALALKKILGSDNNVAFYVDELQQEKIDMRPDPFLLLTVGTQHFYVDVWEEPDFEARKVV